MKIFLAVSLNPIKQFDHETCQPNSLSISSFKLNRMGADPKWITQFNGSKNNLNDR